MGAKELQNEKLKLQVELNDLLKSPSKNEDDINALRSEILYIDKKIEKIIGKKEIDRRNEINRKKERLDDINKNNYYSLKSMVKKISPMNVATNRILNTLSNLKLNEEERVKVR